MLRINKLRHSDVIFTKFSENAPYKIPYTEYSEFFYCKD